MASLYGMFAMVLVAGARGDWVQQEPKVRPYNPDHSMWVLESAAPADGHVTLTVALKVAEDRRAMLEKSFWEVSDPQHEKYGQHLAIDDITELLSVPQERVSTVVQYLKDSGATSVVIAPNRDMLTVTMPVSAAEQALNTKLGSFKHSERENVRIVRASTTYYLPEEIDSHVELVGELLQFPRLRLKGLKGLQATENAASWPNACSASGCNGLVTPQVLAQRYKLPNASDASVSGSSMAVAEFQGQYYVESDLTKFSTACHRDVKVDKTIGGNQPEAGVEAELDIEYIKGVAPNVPLTVIYSNTYSLLDWANQITNMKDVPLVHSVSYGNDEIQQSSRQFMLTCNTAFMKAGARGISIFFASGDQGVCGRSGCGLFMHSRFHPDFPAGSPYVTAVGGTDFVAQGVVGDEKAWSDGGGGFSDNFDIPEWQKAAVAAYKASPDANLPPAKLWNNTGRGYPDVAALGGQVNPYCVVSGGQFSGVAGTSASSPVVAGVFALLNGLRTSKNKSPLGFVNPFIYQNSAAFNDVQSGVNGGGKVYGFKAVKGWDAATGLGTPNFEALSKAVVASASSATSVIV
jgi:tripeptidyl-peptidase-1